MTANGTYRRSNSTVFAAAIGCAADLPVSWSESFKKSAILNDRRLCDLAGQAFRSFNPQVTLACFNFVPVVNAATRICHHRLLTQ